MDRHRNRSCVVIVIGEGICNNIYDYISESERAYDKTGLLSTILYLRPTRTSGKMPLSVRTRLGVQHSVSILDSGFFDLVNVSHVPVSITSNIFY
jgi:hypothetical protein